MYVYEFVDSLFLFGKFGELLVCNIIEISEGLQMTVSPYASECA